METPEQWNERRRKEIVVAENDAKWPQIECPECNIGLENKEPHGLLMSNPPKIRLDCPKCEQIYYVLA